MGDTESSVSGGGTNSSPSLRPIFICKWWSNEENHVKHLRHRARHTAYAPRLQLGELRLREGKSPAPGLKHTHSYFLIQHCFCVCLLLNNLVRWNPHYSEFAILIEQFSVFSYIHNVMQPSPLVKTCPLPKVRPVPIKQPLLFSFFPPRGNH